MANLGYDVWQLLASMLLGILLAFVLDMGLALERGWGLQGAWLQVVDLLAWGVGSLVFFAGAYLFLGLALRFYVPLGAGIGAVLYRSLGSPVLSAAAIQLFRWLAWGGGLPLRLGKKLFRRRRKRRPEDEL